MRPDEELAFLNSPAGSMLSLSAEALAELLSIGRLDIIAGLPRVDPRFCPVCGWEHFNDRCVRCRRSRQSPKPINWIPRSVAGQMMRAILDDTVEHDPIKRVFIIPEETVFRTCNPGKSVRKVF